MTSGALYQTRGAALTGVLRLRGAMRAPLLLSLTAALGAATACAEQHAAPPPPWEGVVSLGEAFKLVGAFDDASTGSSVACAGDVDADGVTDVLIGAPHDPTGGPSAGAAYLFLGPLSERRSVRAADATLVGEAPRDGAGVSVAAAGDVDGDGHDDLVVGAWHNDGAASNSGAAYLIYGPTVGTISLADADVRIVGEGEEDSAGFVVAGAGDLDGDGRDDLVVSAFHAAGERPDEGAVYVLYGPLARGTLSLRDVRDRIVGETPGDHAGIAVAPAGDLNGDGRDDLIVGAPFHGSTADDAGAAYVVHGPVRGTFNLGFAAARLTGEGAGDLAGSAVAAVGDVSGDSVPDVVVGAPFNGRGGEHAGAAYVLFGPLDGPRSLSSADLVLVGSAPGEEAGISVAGVPDVDGDGLGELVVGAWGARGGRGAAYVVHDATRRGERSLAEAHVRLDGEHPDDGAGISVGGCDVDGDGLGDVLVGAYADDAGGANAGAAYLLRGR